MEEVSVEESFLIATAAEKKRRSINYERKRRDIALELLKKKQKVTTILGNDQFKAELEGILKTQLKSDGQPRRPRQLHDTSERQLDTTSTFRNIPRRGSLYGRVNNIIPINDLRGVNASKYTIGERELRCKLASLYRLVDWLGWGQNIYNHITVKTSQGREQFLINPFGLTYSEVTASNLVTIDLSGNVLDPGTTQLGCNLAGYMLHSAIHEARPEVRCVIHVHTAPGVAVAAMACGLLPISQEALTLGGISYHDYRGIFVDEGEKEEIGRDLGPTNKVMILRNHGLVTLGSTIEEAFEYMYNLVLACESQVQALSCGIANLIHVPKEVSKRVHDVGTQGGGGVCQSGRVWGTGELEFEASMRMLDNMGYNTGYPYRGMELLQPAVTTDMRRSLEGRKAHQKTRASKSRDFQSKEDTTLEEKTLLHPSVENPPVGLITTNKVSEAKHLTDDGRTLTTVRERQEPAAVTISPPSSAVDDAWDFLSDSPQKVLTETNDQPGCHASDELWSFLDDDAVSRDMPARMANSSSSGSRRSSDNETDLSRHLTDTERNSNLNVELTARHVANTTSDAVRTLANRSEDPVVSLKKAIITDSVTLQEAQSFSTDHNSPANVHEIMPMNDLAGLQKVIVTAERVAASTGGAVLKLGSSFHQ